MKRTIEVEGYDVTITSTKTGFLVSVPDLPGLSMSFTKEDEEKIGQTMRQVIMDRVTIKAEQLVNEMVRKRRLELADKTSRLKKKKAPQTAQKLKRNKMKR